MGYTNYWIRTEKPITQSFVDAVKSIVSEANKMGISIRGWDGDGDPEITLDYIGFNGNKQYNLDHETCFFNNIASDRGFNFCKTAEKPYDWVVKQVLKEAKKEGLVVDVTDDGEVKVTTDIEYRFPMWLIKIVRQTMGLDADDYTRDGEIICMSHRELFDAWLTWNGIIGYTKKILDTIEEIYKITLEEE